MARLDFTKPEIAAIKAKVYFTEMEEIDTPTLPKAVSFDFVNSKMYYCSRTNEIYEFDASNNSWTYYGQIDLSNVDVDITGGGKSYNQDFAVRDNYFYLSIFALLFLF